MRAPVLAVLAATLAASTLAGCGGGADAPARAGTTPPDRYVAAVQAALTPPGSLASIVAAYPTRRPTAGAVRALVVQARARLDELRRMRLDDRRLAAQRDRFAGAYDAVVFHMDRVAADLSRGDGAALRRHSRTFFASLEGLSSAVSPSR